MKLIKKLSRLLFTVSSIAFIQHAAASNCTIEDEKYAKHWDNYYTPQEAYNVGKILQLLIANKDTSGLFNYVDGELQYGPRKSYALSKPFDHVFPKEWVETVLSGEPSCSPVGWRGFDLGHGHIWFNKRDGVWKIRAINSATREEATTPAGWTVNGKMTHPLCFTYPWMSGDNFEELADQYHIKDGAGFSFSPGQFIGKKITDFNPITPRWCDGEDCEKIALVNSLQECNPTSFDYERSDHGISLNITDESNSTIHRAYRLIHEVSIDTCQQLAPHLDAQCKESYLLSVGSYSGGSMGWFMVEGIFGLFDLPGFGDAIVPLKFFSNENEGLNFLDTM